LIKTLLIKHLIDKDTTNKTPWDTTHLYNAARLKQHMRHYTPLEWSKTKTTMRHYYAVSLSIRCIICSVFINQVYYLQCLYQSVVLFVVSLSIRCIIHSVFINQEYYLKFLYQSGVLFIVSLSIRCFICILWVIQLINIYTMIGTSDW
jgi:hypothetical protein